MTHTLATQPVLFAGLDFCATDDQCITLREPLELDSGYCFTQARVGVRMCGPVDAPVVVVLGGISAGRRPVAVQGEESPGWWQKVLGGEGVDIASRYRVVGIDYLGGVGLTESPRNQDDPAEFPQVTSLDQARLLIAVLDQLQITRVNAVIGASYGGMVALHLASQWPGRFGRAMVLACAHRPEPMAAARRHVQKKILRLAATPDEGRAAVEAARALAMTTYRSAGEFSDRFQGPDGLDSLASYLDYQGRRFAGAIDPESYLRLLESIDSHRVEPAEIAIPLLLVGFDTDEICPPQLLEELVRQSAGQVSHHQISSIYGHDGFLCEQHSVASLVSAFLQGESK